MLTIGSTERGIVFEAASGAPWTPAQFPGLSVYYDGLTGMYAVNPPSGSPISTPGTSIQSAKALWGTTNGASATALLEPTWETNGVNFDTLGVQYLTPAGTIVMDETVGFTFYCVIDYIGDVAVLGNLTLGGYIGTLQGQFNFLDDAQNQVESSVTLNPGINLLRLGCDTNGFIYLNCTGQETPSDVGPFLTTATYNQIGQDTANSIFNGDSGNGIQLIAISNQYIALGSPADLSFRSYIATNYNGASL